MRSSNLLALAASLSSVSAVSQGFNYGSTKEDGYTFRVQSDYQSLFSTAKNLVGTSGGFTSARLYTTIQGGTASDYTSAIPAAIAEDTSLLLGLWGSGGQASLTNEITALKAAISQFGTSFTNLVVGISVGSEDLYRISPTGIAAKSGVGADPATIASYISQVRSAIAGTALSSAPVGHVDTWTAWVNGSNSAVIDACDFIGMDAYPYFQSTEANSIDNGASLFNDALSVTQAAVGGKPVWITETGFPVSGSTSGAAVPSIANAKTYWDAVGCPNFGKTNIWWFTLEDTDNATPNPSFGITPGNPMSTTPLFDLSCADVQSSSSSSASATATGSSASSAASKSSVSSASVAATATSGLVSSGGALAPTQGNGIGLNTTATASTAATATGAAGGNGTGSTVTTKTTKASGTGSSGSSTTSPATVSQNAASVLSGSAVAAMAALVVAAVAL